jgi:hypothetical protein
MSWVLPAARVQAAANGTGAVVITTHFAATCFTGCSSTSISVKTNVLSSGPAADVRCNLPPFRGVVYNLPTTCQAGLSPSSSAPPTNAIQPPPPPSLQQQPPGIAPSPPPPSGSGPTTPAAGTCSPSRGGAPDHCDSCPSGSTCPKATCSNLQVRCVALSSRPCALVQQPVPHHTVPLID